MKGRVFLRNLALFGGYSLILAGALWLSLQLRFDFQPLPYLERFFPSLLLFLAICLPCLWLFRQFRVLLSFSAFRTHGALFLLLGSPTPSFSPYGMWRASILPRGCGPDAGRGRDARARSGEWGSF